MNLIRLHQINQGELGEFMASGIADAMNTITGDGNFQSFRIQIPSGVASVNIEFPTAYPVLFTPNVVVSLENDYPEPGLMHGLSGINNEDFTLILSNYTTSDHYYAQVLAQI